ncbi:uncharacterized protein METZ01_LOCUS371270, partial [marine metagenome]
IFGELYLNFCANFVCIDKFKSVRRSSKKELESKFTFTIT